MTGALERVEAQAHAFDQALTLGRLHHAWLLTGPEGVGKAAFAHGAALRLLGARPDPGGGPLAVASDDPVARVVAAQAHPDLLVLERRSEDGKLKKSIAVEDARRLPEFFSKSPAMADCRVAIIDSADDLNPSSANALLKTLEEPSGRGVLFLIAHNPGGLLPTIRSRCRTLRFPPWPLEQLIRFVEHRLGLDPAEAERLARLAGGAPGRALSLHAAGALELDGRLAEIISRMPFADERALLSLGDKFRGPEGAGRFALTIALLSEQIQRQADAQIEIAGQGVGAERWAATWQSLAALAPQVEALNLDRADALGVVISELRAAARVRAPVAC